VLRWQESWDPPCAHSTDFQLVVQNFFNTPCTNSYFLWQFKNSYVTISPNKFTNFHNFVWIDRSSWSLNVRFIFNMVSSFSKWFRPTEHPWLSQIFIPKLRLKPDKDLRRNDTFLREKFDNYTLRNTVGYCLLCHLDCTWWLRRRGTRLVWVASLNMSQLVSASTFIQVDLCSRGN
jgi:hypothetical protein